MPQALAEPELPVGSHAHFVGLSVLAAGAGAMLGIKYGGLYGGVAGSMFGGALVNAVRAFKFYRLGVPEADKEAQFSLGYGVAALAVGLAVWFKMVEPRRARGQLVANPPRQQVFDPTLSACGIRPVGP